MNEEQVKRSLRDAEKALKGMKNEIEKALKIGQQAIGKLPEDQRGPLATQINRIKSAMASGNTEALDGIIKDVTNIMRNGANSNA